MATKSHLAAVGEAVGTLAVAISPIHVGVQVRRNTLAVQTATSQSVYDHHREFTQLTLENPELAELQVRACRRTCGDEDHPAFITAVASVALDACPTS